MANSQPIGSDNELFAILDAAWTSGDELSRPSRADLLAWRDAAVARRLAQGGAVHPEVHTPARVMAWLGAHGWQAAVPTDPSTAIAEWVHADGGESVSICLYADAVNYAGYAVLAIAAAAGTADLTVPEALLEISQMPDEVAW